MDAADALELDDQAMAVRVGASQRQVLLVSEGNLFLRTALRLLPGVALTETVPSESLTYDPAFDLVIFDRYVPAAELPANHLLFIAPPASTKLFTVSGMVAAPRLRPVTADHPLLQYTLLGEISVMDAAALPLPEWAQPVVAGEAGGESYPILFIGKPEGRRVAVIAFDLRHSDLPLDVSFPILLNHLVNWLVSENRPSAGIPSQLAPGENLTFSLSPAAERAVITRPDGASVTLQPDETGTINFGDTGRLGLYTIRMGDEVSAFAVNLFSAQESNLRPLDALAGIESTGAGEGGEQQTRREWWRWFALAGLAVLLAEWLLYNRAGLARLRAMIIPQKGERGFRFRRASR